MPEEKEKLDKLKIELRKEEARRKLLYAKNELDLFKQDYRFNALKVLFDLAKKYNIESDDLKLFLEISPFIQ